jgi:hypothetical protein
VIVERALAKELLASVNHNDLGYLEQALGHLLAAEKLPYSAQGLNPRRSPDLARLQQSADCRNSWPLIAFPG